MEEGEGFEDFEEEEEEEKEEAKEKVGDKEEEDTD